MYESIKDYHIKESKDFNDLLIIDGSDFNNDDTALNYFRSVGLAEYLNANRLFTKIVLQKDLSINFIKNYRGFIFLNVKINPLINYFVEKCKYFNKTIFKFADDSTNFPEAYGLKDLPLYDNKISIPDEIFSTLGTNYSKDHKLGTIVTTLEDARRIEQYLSLYGENLVNSKLVVLTSVNNQNLIFSEKILHKIKIISYRNELEKIYIIKKIKNFIQLENKDSFLNIVLNNSFDDMFKSYNSLYASPELHLFIRESLNKLIVFNVAGTIVRGGINVIVKHANTLRKNGFDVTLISDGDDEKNIITEDGELNVVLKQKSQIRVNIDKLVSTLWITNFFVETYPDALEKLYLVQGFETDFSAINDSWRLQANITYLNQNIQPITISRWCQRWLKEQYNREAKFCPNGLNTRLFNYKKRNFSSGKIRILIEGSNRDEFRNIDESFRITNKLAREKFEVWYLTYDGHPKDWYKLDRFWHKVPYSEVKKIYQSCHILLKSSSLESFSYPPLEMMSTGGIAVVALNDGNSEYVLHGENSMVYKSGDEETALKYINEVVWNKELREKLIINGRKLAESREWANIENNIVELYK